MLLAGRRDAPRRTDRATARTDAASFPAAARWCTAKRISCCATMPLTISPISRWISGSPPGIATIGAPHSSTASRHSLTDRRRLRIGIGIIDFAAAEAGEIAAEQRLKHEDQRIALPAQQLLLEDVGADARFLEERNLHASGISPLARCLGDHRIVAICGQRRAKSRLSAKCVLRRASLLRETSLREIGSAAHDLASGELQASGGRP